MRKTTRKSVVAFLGAVILFATGNVFGADDGLSPSLSPGNLTVTDDFKPGIGEPVGKIRMAVGEAAVIHGDASEAYRVRVNLPLYNKDILITGAKARLRFFLNDGSITTLAADTKLTIRKSAYDAGKKDRSTFLDMEAGKARFWAVKMKDFKNSEFKVKTKTAVAGVRGSDFVIVSSDNATEVTTLKDTLLDVFSLAQPEAEPVLLSDFMRSKILSGELASAAEKVQMEEIERLMKEFLFAGESYDPDRMVRVQAETAEGAPAEDSGTPQSGDDWEDFAKKGILLPDSELYKPDLTDMQKMLEGFRLSDVISPLDFIRIEDEAQNRQSDFSEVIRENEAAKPDYEQLPGPVEGP